jgi:hypothetical protein
LKERTKEEGYQGRNAGRKDSKDEPKEGRHRMKKEDGNKMMK